MADIDFGTGPNTPTGDTIQQALTKLQTRIAALEAGGGTGTGTGGGGTGTGGGTGGSTPTVGSKTTFPTRGTMLYEMDPAAAGVADGARASSVPHSASGITATGPKGPIYVANAANGLPGLQYNNDANEYLAYGTPSSMVNAINSNSVTTIIVFKNAGGSNGNNYAAMFSDDFGGSGFRMSASPDRVAINDSPRNFSSADSAANVHTLVFTKEDKRAGRFYLDGTLYIGAVGNIRSASSSSNLMLGCLFVNGNPFQGFQGTILNMRMLNVPLTPPEVLQVHFWACTRWGKALPIAGRSYFPLMDGDSQTNGTSATSPNASFPAQLAASRGWPMGAFGQVGKPGCTVAAGSSGGYNMTDLAAEDVDGFADVTGLPVVLISGEYYNQGIRGGTTAQGVGYADNNRAYGAARAATGKFAKHLIWTSVDCDREGAARTAFNQSLVDNHPNIDAVIPVHTDPKIGVDGTYTNSTYFDQTNANTSGEVAHPIDAGYAVLASLIDAGLTSAGYTN